ncbi:recombinase family protein [Streptomyces sp. NPDC051243]|uniref:recombinase family protein n=1 Tax=Streptomyces sp. NPDC051243 TaxID=3365646 RepID=UPI0037A6D502
MYAHISDSSRASRHILAAHTRTASAPTTSTAKTPHSVAFLGLPTHGPHPGESEVVWRGVQSLLRGNTVTAITRDFADSGCLSTLGNPWQYQTVKQILRNPRIGGYRKIDGILVCDSDGKPVVGQWKPIVSPEEWLAVTEILDKQRHSGGWKRSGVHSREDARYLLTGLVRCGRPTAGGRQCGAPMHGHPVGTSHVYRCRSALDGGCGRTSRQGPAMDELITEYALEKLGPQKGLELKPTIPWPGLRDLEIAKQHKSALQERWYAGEMSDSDYFSQLTSEETRIKRLVNEQQAWVVEHHLAAYERCDTQPYWDGLSFGARREILFSLLKSVFVLPGTKGSHRFEPSAIVPVWR